MRRYIILAALAATSCTTATGPDLGQAMKQCGYNETLFVQSWPCVRSVFATRRDANPDIQAAFLVRGNAIWRDARDGKVTDEQALALLDEAGVQAMRAERRADMDRAAIAATMPPMFSTTGIRPQSPQPVMCNQLGTTLFCQ